MDIPLPIVQFVNVEPSHDDCECTGCVVDGSLTISLCRIHKAGPELLEACKAGIEYNNALEACGNDPDKMTSYCTAKGDDLDNVYIEWMNKTRIAMELIEGK